MTAPALRLLLWSGGAFALVKVAFQFASFLADDSLDADFKRSLKSFFDLLATATLADVYRAFFGRLVSRVREALDPRGGDPWCVRNLLLLLIALYSVNATAYLVAATRFIRDHPDMAISDYPFHVQVLYFASDWAAGNSSQGRWIICAATLGSVFSLGASLALLRRASVSIGTVRLLSHMAAVVATTLLISVGLILALRASIVWYDWGSNTETNQYLLSHFIRSINSRHPRLWIFLGTVASVATLPLLVYAASLLVLTATYFQPRAVHWILARVAFRLSSGKSSVLAQLGTACGGLAAIIGAIVALVQA